MTLQNGKNITIIQLNQKKPTTTWSIDAGKMGPQPIGSFAASGTALDAAATAARCVQYSINQ